MEYLRLCWEAVKLEDDQSRLIAEEEEAKKNGVSESKKEAIRLDLLEVDEKFKILDEKAYWYYKRIEEENEPKESRIRREYYKKNS